MNPEQWLSLKWNGGSTMSDRWLNQSKIIHVYGSYARGDYNSSSDVDVMILVKMSDNEIKKIENQVYDLAFDIEMDTGVDISPIIKNEEQYEYWLDTLPFYKNIHEEGVIVNG